MDELFHFLWINEDPSSRSDLPEMQLMSLRSFLSFGHKVILWTYTPISNVPSGAEVRDGTEILKLDYNVYEKRYFSNVFRYHLLFRLGGWWVDTDVICMKPFVFEEPHVFASYDDSYDNPHSLNNNVIKAPKGSWIMKDWIKICEKVMEAKDNTPLILGPLMITTYFKVRKELRYLVKPRIFFNQLNAKTVVENLAMLPYNSGILYPSTIHTGPKVPTGPVEHNGPSRTDGPYTSILHSRSGRHSEPYTSIVSSRPCKHSVPLGCVDKGIDGSLVPQCSEGDVYGVHFYGWMWRPPHQVRLTRKNYNPDSFYCQMARRYLLPWEYWENGGSIGPDNSRCDYIPMEPLDRREEFSFMWVSKDEEIPEMQLMSLKSFLAHGHRVVLWIYGHLSNIPSGVEVREGKKIFPFNPLGREPRFFSDLFRYHLLYTIGGWWIDMDVVCMKPFEFKDPHVFSLFDDNRDRYRFMNNDVIRAPKGSTIMKEFMELTRCYIETKPNINLIAGPDLLSKYFRLNRQYDKFLKESIYFNQFPINVIMDKLALQPYDPSMLSDPRITGVHLCAWIWRNSKHKREDYHPESFYSLKVKEYL